MDISTDALKEKARQWAASVVELYNTPVPPDMQARKDKLLKYAKTVKEAIEKVFPNFKDIADTGQALGFLPVLVPAALIIAAGAAITYWYYDYNKFVEDLRARKALQENLTNSGTPAGQASDIVAKVFGDNKTAPATGFGAQFGKAILPIGLVAVAYLFMRGKA